MKYNNFFIIKLSEKSYIQKIKPYLNKIGYKELLINDFSFCPYFMIWHVINNNENIYYYGNYNEGFIKKLNTEYNCIYCLSIDDFLNNAIQMKNNINENALF